MKIKIFLPTLFLSLLPVTASWAATPEQCYSYFTELVRSSNFSFSEWGVKPHQVNLVIDEDDEFLIRAKLIMDTEGTGTIGWVIFDKNNNELYNTTIDPDEPIRLTFNNEYNKAQKYCLVGEIVYQVKQNERLNLFDKTEKGFKKTPVFIVKGDYVNRREEADGYSHITYQTKSGSTVSGWVDSAALREIDFKNAW